MERIYSDEEVFDQMKEKSRKKAFIKTWQEFKAFKPSFNYEVGPPGEDLIIGYFRHLTLVKKLAPSTLSTAFFYLKSVLKRKYGGKLPSLTRVPMYIKSCHEVAKHKAAIHSGMEEDPGMAGIPVMANPTNDQQSIIETTIKQAMSSLPAANGGNVTMKIVIVNNMSGNINL